MKTKLPFLLSVMLLAVSAARAEIVLDEKNTTYEYWSGNGVEDPAAAGDNLAYNDELKCYAMVHSQAVNTGTLTYTFKVSAGIASLNIRSYHFYLYGEIAGSVSVDDGASQPLFVTGPVKVDNDVTPGVGISAWVPVPEVDGNDLPTGAEILTDGNIAQDPSKPHTVVLTFSAQGHGNWNQQVLRAGGAALLQDLYGEPQSLIVTATTAAKTSPKKATK